VIFYNADLGMVSPAVSDYWPRPVQELLQESEAMFTTNFPSASCTRVIGLYLIQLRADYGHLRVDNLPMPVRNYDGDEEGPPADWLERAAEHAGRLCHVRSPKGRHLPADHGAGFQFRRGEPAGRCRVASRQAVPRGGRSRGCGRSRG
jgi:hypothetical protein